MLVSLRLASVRLGALLGAFLVATSAAAQTPLVAVTGSVADSTGAPLPGANAVLLQPSDSLLVGFGAVGADGRFRVRRVRPGAYLLRVTFVGYAPVAVPVEVGAADLDVGQIVLREAAGELGRVVVTDRRLAVAVRRDTVEYDATVVGVRPGATVEDLLRRLPGVEVGRDGAVTAQGRPVRRVLVDGEEFFPGAPSAATRNLPADIVDRVQVYDEEPTADGRPGERTLNLALKPDRRTGTFGLASAGLGRALPDDPGLRYTGRLSANRFAPGSRATLIANANNINEEAFSRDDYFQMMGGIAALAAEGGTVTVRSSDLPATGDGFIATWAAGGSAARTLGPRTRLQASYVGFRSRAERDRRTLRRLTPAGTGDVRETDETEQDETRHAHRLSATATTTYRPGHDLRVRSGVYASASDLDRQLSRVRLEADGQVRQGAAAEQTAGQGTGGDLEARYRRGLAPGATFVAEAGAKADASRDDARLDALGDTDSPFARPASRTRRAGLAEGWASATSTHAVAPRTRLRAQAALRTSRQSLAQDATFVGDAAPDSGPSEPFARRATSARAGLGAERTAGPWEASARLDAEATRLDAGSGGAEPLAGRSRLWLNPQASLGVRGRRNQTLRLRYAALVRQPTAGQLAPLADAANPFQRTTGNPGLREERVHEASAQYGYFDSFTSTTAFAFVQASHIDAAISLARRVSGLLVPEATYVNLRSRQQAVVGGQLGLPLWRGRAVVRLNPTVLWTRGWESVDGVDGRYSVLSLQGDARVGAGAGGPVDAELGVRVSAQRSAFARSGPRVYASAAPFVEASLAPSAAWEFRLRAEGDVRTRQPSVFPGAPTPGVRPLVGVEVSRAVGPRGLRLHLAASDLLDQTRRVDYRATAFQTEETTTQTLGRHVTVKLARNL